MLEDFLIGSVSISAYKVSPLIELNQGTCEGHLQVLLAEIRGEFIRAKRGIIIICFSLRKCLYFRYSDCMNQRDYFQVCQEE